MRAIAILLLIAVLPLASKTFAARPLSNKTTPVRPSTASAAPRVAQQNDIAIIVNKSNPTGNLSLEELREYFLAERNSWSHGKKVRVAMLGPGRPERESVLQLVCGMKREQDFTSYFLRAKFSEQALEEPRRLESTADMIRFVANVPGAIGYVRANEVDPSVSVLRVDNLSPGDPGYKLKS